MGNETHLTHVKEGGGKEGRKNNSIERSGRNVANLQMWRGISDRWTDHGEMAREGGNARRERWFGAESEFVFDLSGTRDGIDMHEFIETAGGIEENEVMLTNKNTAELKSLRTE
jgi:hypothetical protein